MPLEFEKLKHGKYYVIKYREFIGIVFLTKNDAYSFSAKFPENIPAMGIHIYICKEYGENQDRPIILRMIPDILLSENMEEEMELLGGSDSQVLPKGEANKNTEPPLKD